MTWGIVAANVAVFIGELVYTNGLDPCLEDRLFYAYGLVPYSLANDIQLSLQCSTGILSTSGTSPLVYLTPVTSMFLHADFLHIGGNMLFLLVFGGKIEELFGRARYLVSYLACGIVGGLAMVALSLAVGPPNVY